MAELTDRDLINRVVGGDPIARKEFERRYRRLIKGVIGRMRLPGTVGIAAAQEVWVKMLDDDCRVLRLWRGGDSFGPYLARIVRNCALDVLRSFRRRPIPMEPDGHEENQPTELPSLGPLELVSKDDEVRRIEELVSGLSPRDQDLFWRRFIFEQSGAEIAKALGLEPNAVHVRLHRLRGRLTRILQDQAPELFARVKRLEGDRAS